MLKAVINYQNIHTVYVSSCKQICLMKTSVYKWNNIHIDPFSMLSDGLANRFLKFIILLRFSGCFLTVFETNKYGIKPNGPPTKKVCTNNVYFTLKIYYIYKIN